MADQEVKKKLDQKNTKEDKKMQKPPQQPKQQEIPTQVSNQIDEILRRIRMLEERYSGLRKKTQFTEQNMLKDTKDLFEEIKVVQDTITEVKSDLAEMDEKLLKLNEEVKGTVKKTEFNVLSKYVEFWQPLNFLTREDAEKLIKEYKK